MLHYDGSSWSQEAAPVGQPGELTGVWGSGPGDVFAVGQQGTILHLSNGSWSAMSSGTGAALGSVWGTGPRDVVVVGDKVMLQLSCQ